MTDSANRRVTIGIDLGTTFSSVAACSASSQPQILKFPGDGSQIQSAVHLDTAGNVTVGRKAVRTQAFKEPERYFVLFKRLLPLAPDTPVCDGGPTPIELTSHLLGHFWQHACQLLPETRSACDRGQLTVVVTHPASYRTVDQQVLVKAAELVGDGFDIHHFMSEPVASIHWLRRDYGSRLTEGDLVFVSDIGGGTTDHTILRFEQGVFNEVAADLGDPQLGGLNFTRRIALRMCDHFGWNLTACFDPNLGLDLGNAILNGADLRLAAMVWDKAEEAKISLGTNDACEVFIETPSGLVDYEISRDEFMAICHEEYDAFTRAVTSTLDGLGYDWDDIKHVSLVGGSAGLPGIRDHLAMLTHRGIDNVLVNPDSNTVNSEGAAFFGHVGEETTKVLPGGLAFKVYLAGASNGSERYKFFLRPGHAFSARGESVEDTGQFIDVQQEGPTSIELVLAEAKPETSFSDADGPRPLAGSGEVVPIHTIRERCHLPAGRHEVVLGFDYSRRNLTWRLNFANLPNVELLAGSVFARKDEISDDESAVPEQRRVVLAIDTSGSMDGQKLMDAKDALHRLIDLLSDNQVEAGLVSFGGSANVVSPLSHDPDALHVAVNSLRAAGGTPMGEAIALSRDLLGTEQGHDRFLILISDGHPNQASPVPIEATWCHEMGIRLLTVGVGANVSEDLLHYHVASTPNDYRFVDTASELVSLLEEICRIYVLND